MSIRFVPYRGNDVEGHVKITVGRHKNVWAYILPTDEAWRQTINQDPYKVICLVWGEQPGILWCDLDQDTQNALLTTLQKED